MWRAFSRFGSFPWVYRLCGTLNPIFMVLSAFLVIGWIWGLLFAPPDYLQGNSYRIIYLHVPAAFMAQAIYASMAIAGFVGLIWRMKMAEVAIVSALPIGISMTFLALVSGAIWGKPTWGDYWVWDARLTSMLLLFFLYLGLMALASGKPDKRAGQALCLLALIGALNLPIIKYSVEWWYTLHQPASLSLTEESSIAPEMRYPLLVSIFGMYMLCGWLFVHRLQLEILRRDARKQWVREVAKNGI